MSTNITNELAALILTAIEPVADAAGDWDSEANDGHVFADSQRLSADGNLTVGDLRKTRAIYALLKYMTNQLDAPTPTTLRITGDVNV
jgi:hypothetical protein